MNTSRLFFACAIYCLHIVFHLDKKFCDSEVSMHLTLYNLFSGVIMENVYPRDGAATMRTTVVTTQTK